jgi:uncharacterized membrane protein YhaH (DUF805 family)
MNAAKHPPQLFCEAGGFIALRVGILVHAHTSTPPPSISSMPPLLWPVAVIMVSLWPVAVVMVRRLQQAILLSAHSPLIITILITAKGVRRTVITSIPLSMQLCVYVCVCVCCNFYSQCS